MAASYALQEILWLQRLIQGMLPHQKMAPIQFYLNNKIAIQVAANVAKTKHRKHIDIRHHHFADAVQFEQIQVRHILFQRITADILTKSVAANTLHSLVHLQPSKPPNNKHTASEGESLCSPAHVQCLSHRASRSRSNQKLDITPATRKIFCHVSPRS